MSLVQFLEFLEKLFVPFDFLWRLFVAIVTPPFIYPIVILLLLFPILLSSVDLWMKTKISGNRPQGGALIRYLLVDSFGRFARFVVSLITRLPILIGLAVCIIGLGLIGRASQELTEYLERQKKIEELSVVVTHLKNTTVAAELEILEQKEGYITALISYYTGNKKAHEQTINLRGNRLYFEAQVLNFEYALIQSGTILNIAIPTTVYSDIIPQAEGIPLDAHNYEGIPWAYLLDEQQIYGLDPAVFHKHLQLVSKYFTDPALARSEGIRSIVNQGVAQNLEVGDLREIVVQNTGGITIRRISKNW